MGLLDSTRRSLRSLLYPTRRSLRSLLDPTLPPYDAIECAKRPLSERGSAVCAAWAIQGYGSPASAYLVYAAKIAAYVGVWIAFCKTSFSGPIGSFWLEPIAFQKAIVWSLLFEVLGLGCGSGPLTGRYYPPVGGFLYFLRPGTTKLPFFVASGHRRSIVDVALYLALVVACLRALASAAPGFGHFLPIVVLLPILGVLDKTIFLAARAEHFWVMTTCFAFATPWIAGAKAVQLALWFFAGFSKLNHHFPTVACVMTSNGPFTRFEWMRRAMYRDYPRDLRPSKLAEAMAHGGTILEVAVPIAFLLTPLGAPPLVAIGLMLALHLYIVSNVPMGVPLEWNVVVVYGGFALFWAHPDVSLLAIGPSWMAAFVVAWALVIPLLGNFFPERISFLLAMRYYAGNWAYSVWLFRGDSHRKLDKLVKTSPWVPDQLRKFYDEKTCAAIMSKVVAFRMMHLHGRALAILVPKAIDQLHDYEWVDGEMVAGIVLGWNFGEGHLHHEQLLAAVQAQCDFDEGELRCIFVESQPLGRSTLSYRIADAKRGVLESGVLPVAELRSRQPWESAAAMKSPLLK